MRIPSATMMQFMAMVAVVEMLSNGSTMKRSICLVVLYSRADCVLVECFENRRRQNSATVVPILSIIEKTDRHSAVLIRRAQHT